MIDGKFSTVEEVEKELAALSKQGFIEVLADIKNGRPTADEGMKPLIRLMIESNPHYLKTCPYERYLETDHWQAIRNLALKEAKYKCSLCNKAVPLDVHHRSYKHRGNEQNHIEDVTVLCRDCHQNFHSQLQKPPIGIPVEISMGG